MSELKQYKMFIDGKWVDSESKKTFKSLNPENNEPWVEVPQASEKDIDNFIEALEKSISLFKQFVKIMKKKIQQDKLIEALNFLRHETLLNFFVH